ncbi:hypothetical protein D3C73_1393810 [compost metagenome]
MPEAASLPTACLLPAGAAATASLSPQSIAAADRQSTVLRIAAILNRASMGNNLLGPGADFIDDEVLYRRASRRVLFF